MRASSFTGSDARCTGTITCCGSTVSVTAGRHWLRLEVRDASGAKELMSSPLYINFPQE